MLTLHASDAVTCSVGPDRAGLRLDAFLGGAVSGLGVRGGRRLLAQGRVLVNGAPRPALYRVRAEDVLTVLPAASGPGAEDGPLEEAVRLVALTDAFAALYKPPGLHTAALSGKSGASLEEALPRLWPSLCAAAPESARRRSGPALPAKVLELLPLSAGTPVGFPCPPCSPPLLLSRLDKDTSGLVAAARTPEAAARFRDLEAAGRVNKYYLALVRGRLAEPVLCAARLDTDSRRKTRTPAGAVEPDPARHTLVSPAEDASRLFPELSPPLTLVVARIRRGARHQIRAHLAALGLPIAGDSLYGTDAPGSPLFLHHACLTLPGFSAFCAPPFLR